MANHFKHHEEWKDWEPKGQQKETILALRSANIGKNDHYPYNMAISLLLQNDGEDLTPVASILRNWRYATISELKQKYQT